MTNEFVLDGCNFTFNETDIREGVIIEVIDSEGPIGEVTVDHASELVTYTRADGDEGTLNYWETCDEPRHDPVNLHVAKWLAATSY